MAQRFMRYWPQPGRYDRLRMLAPALPLASRSAQARANLVCPHRFWRGRPKLSPPWRIARIDPSSTWGTIRAPTTRYTHALPGGSRLSKIDHLGIPQRRLRPMQQPNLLQQPRHQLVQPSFGLDENILRLDLLYVLPAKLDFFKFTR